MGAPTPTLHPAQNRGFRELYAAARQQVTHWRALQGRVGGEAASALDTGTRAAERLLEELADVTAEHGLYGYPAAQNVGLQFAAVRANVADRFLERNQALRQAVLDAEHVTLLLGYLAAVARGRGQDELAEFCDGHERRLRRAEAALRRAAVAEGANPDRAVQPLDRSPLGRAAHGAGFAFGTVGEWFDRRVARRRSE